VKRPATPQRALAGFAAGLLAIGVLLGLPSTSVLPAGAAQPSTGYSEVGLDGGVFAFGSASYFGSMGGQPLNGAIKGIVASPDGKGYWLFATDGGVFAFGDAPFVGSSAMPSNARIPSLAAVGMALNAPNLGYWLVTTDRGIFALSHACNTPYYGSISGTPLNGPVVGIAQT
jgi:hypothetical protein